MIKKIFIILAKDLKIDLKEVFLVLEPFKFKIKLKTLGTNIRYNEEKIQIETIKSDISLKSLFYKEFSLRLPKIYFLKELNPPRKDFLKIFFYGSQKTIF